MWTILFAEIEEEVRSRLAETPALPYGSTAEEINRESSRRIREIRQDIERERAALEETPETPEESPACHDSSRGTRSG